MLAWWVRWLVWDLRVLRLSPYCTHKLAPSGLTQPVILLMLGKMSTSCSQQGHCISGTWTSPLSPRKWYSPRLYTNKLERYSVECVPPPCNTWSTRTFWAQYIIYISCHAVQCRFCPNLSMLKNHFIYKEIRHRWRPFSPSCLLEHHTHLSTQDPRKKMQKNVFN